MYTGAHSNVSWESYFFELFDLPLDVSLVKEINQGHESGTCNSCNMGMRGLPDMYALSAGPQALGIHSNVSGKSQIHMLQVLCITLLP